PGLVPGRSLARDDRQIEAPREGRPRLLDGDGVREGDKGRRRPEEGREGRESDEGNEERDEGAGLRSLRRPGGPEHGFGERARGPSRRRGRDREEDHRRAAL